MKFKAIKQFSFVLQRKVLSFWWWWWFGFGLLFGNISVTSQCFKNKISLSASKQLSLFQLSEVNLH